MFSIREILRQSIEHHRSARQISASLGISRTAVWECLRRARSLNINSNFHQFNEDILIDMLYPKQETSACKAVPDCEYIHIELKQKGVTLSLLWEEYKRRFPEGYQYTQYCQYYRQWRKTLNLTMRQNHIAGYKAFSDFSGGTLSITNPITGELVPHRLFVCTLGASNYTYAELFESESAESWCNGQANAFHFFGGVPELITPDNPKAVVIKADYSDPDLNTDFQNLADHFDVVVAPARVRRPQDKAKVESAVGLATRWILAKLRRETFFTLAEANAAVWLLLEQLNAKKFQKLNGSRLSHFQNFEKEKLKALPTNRYEYAHTLFAKVGRDYHVRVEDCFYSVPHARVGEKLEVRVSSTTVEIFFKGKRIASHLKCFSPGESSSIDSHYPSSHLAYKNWNQYSARDWARKIGPNCESFVEYLLIERKYPELAYRSCTALISLEKRYGKKRIESAFERACAVKSFTVTTIRRILQNQMDLVPLPVPASDGAGTTHSNIRGAAYYSELKGELTC